MGRPSGALETGVIYCDDNLNRMATLPSDSVDLIYLDPPFFSNRIYEVIWGDEAEVRSFEDRWSGGIQVYIAWMRERVREMHRILKPTGSVYLHCDPHASHYLKVMLDEVFGMRNFRNEIIWHYTGWNKKMARHFERRHDSILFYAKSNSTAAAAQQRFLSYSIPWRDKEQYLKTRKQKLHVEPDGREYVMSDAGGGKRVKRYLEEAMQYGRPIDDVWDIDKLNNSSSEALGWPTQKPESLLERIIAASTLPGDVVLDPFCGCGTTVTVAQKMGRQWVGIDISPTAVNIMDRRIKRLPGAAAPILIGLPSTVDSLRALKPFEFQNWVIQQFYGVSSPRKSGDMGIDGYTFLTHDPIQVKQSDSVGRNVVDNFQTAIRRDGSTTGWIVGFSFTRGAREEVARARWQEKLEIKLVTVDDLLKPRTERRGPLWPEPATVTEIPLTGPRSPSEMPSAEQLIASQRAASA